MPRFATLLLLLTLGYASSLSGASVQASQQGFYYPATDFPENATRVTIGVYAQNAYEISPSANTFYWSGYVWLKWTGNDTDPVTGLEFNNAVERWGLTVTPLFETPKELEDGQLLQQLQVQGRFYQPFDLKNYPLDKQSLPIIIEDSSNTRDAVYYVFDETSTMDSTFQIPGWNVGKLSSQLLVHDYATDFGEGTGPALYSAIRITIEIQRGQNLFAWKLLLPLILVLITGWLSLVLHPRYVEVRTAMCATALLTTVFLQQSSMDASQVSSLVMMDQIYVVAYILIVITFALVIWDNNKYFKYLPEEVEKVEKQMELDQVIQEKDAVSKRDMMRDRQAKEDATVKEIRRNDLICLAIQVVLAIVVITTLAVVQSG